jgi:phage recombination protein Bet
MQTDIQTSASAQVIEKDKIMAYLETMNLTTGLTKNQVNQFIEIAQAFGLNPFKREIYASKYGDNFSIIVGFETYIKRAERSGRLSGWNVTTQGAINPGNMAQSDLKAIITIHRKDWEHPFVHEVFFPEYCQKRHDGTLNKFWKEKPLTMLKKVAMAQGFRLCFSDELGGLPYTQEEIQAMPDEETPKPRKSEPVSGSPEMATQVIKAEDILIVQPNEQSQPQPAKRGRKPNSEKEFQNLLVTIHLAQTLDELVAIYDQNPGHQKNQEFISNLSTRKKAIQEMELAHQHQAQVEMNDESSLEDHMAQEVKQTPKDLFDTHESDPY